MFHICGPYILSKPILSMHLNSCRFIHMIHLITEKISPGRYLDFISLERIWVGICNAMYVLMYVCTSMYVCMYVCVYVCVCNVQITADTRI